MVGAKRLFCLGALLMLVGCGESGERSGAGGSSSGGSSGGSGTAGKASGGSGGRGGNDTGAAGEASGGAAGSDSASGGAAGSDSASGGAAGEASGGAAGSDGTGDAGDGGEGASGGFAGDTGAAGFGGEGASGATGGDGGTDGAGAGGGGTGGDGGAGGEAGGCSEPEGDGCPGGGVPESDTPILHTEGWVQACDLDLVGYLFTAADDFGSSIDTGCFVSPNDQICVSGEAAQVAGDPGDYWGALVGLNVCETTTGDCSAAAGWSPGDFGITGFAFDLSGAQIPPLRLTVRTVDDVEYCADVVSSFVPLDNLFTDCWMAGGLQYLGEPIATIQWNIVSNAAAPEPFDFCIDDLEAVVDDACPAPEGPACPGGGSPQADVPLPHLNGWVQACDLDLVGAMFAVADETGSTIDAGCFAGNGSQFCVNGELARVESAATWGAAVGLLLCDPLTASCPQDPDILSPGWEPGAYGVAGFTFNLTGDAIPPLRLTVRTDQEVDYCVDVSQSGFVSLNSLRTQCWLGGGVTEYGGEPISIIQWNLVPNDVAATDFDFCVSDLQATLFGSGSCADRCGAFNPDWSCQCDAECFVPENDDCCADICAPGICDQELFCQAE